MDTHTANSHYELCQPTQLFIRRILLQLRNNRFCWPKLWNRLADNTTSASSLSVLTKTENTFILAVISEHLLLMTVVHSQ